MIISIPYMVKTQDKNGDMKREKKEMQVEVITSFLAHLKWEEEFQEQLGVDLSTYTERVRHWLKSETKSKQNFLGMLKLLYCHVDSPQLPTFKDFVRLFDFDVAEEILEKIGTVLEQVGNTASKN